MKTNENDQLQQFKVKQLEQKKAYQKTYRRLFTGLIVGVILFLIPFMFDSYNKLQQQPLVNDYKKTAIKADKRLPAARRYNRQIVTYQQHKTGKPSIAPVQKKLKEPMGYVTIPAIKVNNMLMYYGESDWVLNRGLGILDWGSLPIGGKNTRSVITGHSGLANHIYFDNIRYLHNGDIIYLHAFGKKMAYKVYKKLVIDPNNQKQVRKLDVAKNRDTITLLTCTPIFINSHRLLVYGKRVPLKKAAKKAVSRRDFWSLDHIWMLVVFLLVLILLIWFVYQRHVYNREVRALTKQLEALEAEKQ